MDILYLDYPLQKAAFSSKGGVWFNNDEPDKLEHKEIIEDCTMDFYLWLKYFTLKQTITWKRRLLKTLKTKLQTK